jgi:hypothetical protein
MVVVFPIIISPSPTTISTSHNSISVPRIKILILFTFWVVTIVALAIALPPFIILCKPLLVLVLILILILTTILMHSLNAYLLTTNSPINFACLLHSQTVFNHSSWHTYGTIIAQPTANNSLMVVVHFH